MKKIYPYYEIKDRVDSFVINYGDKMTKEGWTIESRPCKKTDQIYDISVRENDERYCYVTLTGNKKVNNDYLFFKRNSNGKQKKSIQVQLNNFGFIFNEDGLITDIKNVTGNTNTESVHSID